MKKISILLAICLCLVASTAFAQKSQRILFISEQIISNPTASTAVVVPTDADFAIVSIADYPVHVNMRGATATTSNFKMPISVSTWPNPKDTLYYWRVINTSAGASTVSIAFYKYQ